LTRHEFTKQLPDLTNDPIGVKPPLLFNGVSARIFPLRANLDILQQLCDSLLNIIPHEAGYFRVPFPCVQLAVLDYGQLGESVMRTGWFSQIEVYFGVFVEWYKRVNGSYVFHDFATITPYIFVTDDVSAPVGRMVYGFNKVVAQVRQVKSLWMTKPVSPVVLARVSTTVFPRTYAGGNLEEHVFLEIERRPAANLQIPFNPANAMMPWRIASNLAGAMGGFARDAMWLAQSMRIFPLNPWVNPVLFQQMIGRITPAFAPAGSGFITNSLNLKQFRRESDPTKVCYQSLTNGQLCPTGFNGAGPLGEDCTLLGDFSGGHTIRLYDHSSLPIARTLGLEVDRHDSSGGVGVAELKPVLPYWADVDLKYDAGTNIAWRTDDGIWRDEAGQPFAAPREGAPPFNNQVSTAIEAIAGPFEFSSTTIRVIPLRADKATLGQFIEKYVNKALADGPILTKDGHEEHVRFEVWARPPQAINDTQLEHNHPIGGDIAYVYLTASSFGSVTSDFNNVGNWAKYEVAFNIPVKWRRMEPDSGERTTIGVGLIPAFTLADNCITAISRTEIQGIAALTAQFDRPESVWLRVTPEAKSPQTLLRVKAEVLPALGAGQKATFQPVIEISHTSHESLPAGASWSWAAGLRRELQTKKATKLQQWQHLKVARALSLEILGNQTPFSIYTMKQFPDVTNPDKACYQALVRVPRKLQEVFDVREIEETLAVKLYDYPTLDIVHQLGLSTIRQDQSAAGIVHITQAVRPFYIRCTLSEPLGERLLSRAGTSQWTIETAAFETMLCGKKGAPIITADLAAERLQDQADPRRLGEAMFGARQRMEQRHESAADADVITPEMARSALEVADPQIVIESILSREWGNNDPRARWLQGRRHLNDGFNALPQDGTLKPLTEAELYRLINNQMASRPGSVAAVISRSDLEQTAPPDPEVDTPGEESAKAPQSLDSSRADLVRNQNLTGQGLTIRWIGTLVPMIQREMLFTSFRIDLEECIDSLSPVAIAGLEFVQQAYQFLNFVRGAKPNDESGVPTADEILAKAKRFVQVLADIQELSVKGEPSPESVLDMRVFADHRRLKEWTDVLAHSLAQQKASGASSETILQAAQAHTAELGQVVDLARAYCGIQYEALLNKLSRAFQKPDFCIPRDCVDPADRERLLPTILSWDDNWYYGGNLQLVNPSTPQPVKTGSQSESGGSGAFGPRNGNP
jgi:hypothetical protein